jgi:hypothetical protein
VSSSVEELQLAIKFSRDLYELRDLIEYPFDEDEDDDEEEEILYDNKTEDDGDGMWLTRQQKLLLADSFASLRKNHLNNFFFLANTGGAVIAKALLLVINNDCFSSIISEEHVVAFSSMVTRIENQKITLELSKNCIKPIWSDIQAAHIYQLAYKEFKKYLISFQNPVKNVKVSFKNVTYRLL